MKRKNQPVSIKGTVLTGLSIICILIGVFLAEFAKSAPILSVDDVSTGSVRCANGWANKKCIPGQEYVAHSPSINFIDLDSGPSTGLGDGLGSGAIVTIWGNRLGSSQGSSVIQFCDSTYVNCRTPHVYYWKNADGQLPGGPSNLYKSHKMQEIAISIPAGSADGLGVIRITTAEGVANKAFTVRAGNIKHVSPTGNNANPCTFAQPCAYINGDINPGSGNGGLGNAGLAPGDIVYSHGVQEPTFTAGDGRSSGMYLRGLNGTLANQIALAAYPGSSNFSRITSAGYGIQPYLSSGIVASKFLISVGHANPSDPPNAGNSILSDTHIGTTPNGKAVGNLLVQNAGTCFTGWGGAIVSGGNGGDNFKAFGNHIKELGCDNSSRFAHTVYMSIRNGATSGITPWEFGWNHLDNNKLFYGLHNYDETNGGDCGTMTGTLKLHNNVIVNQRGAGINVSTNDRDAPENPCWAVDIEITNNLLINVGLGPAAEDNVVNGQAIQVGGDLGAANLIIRNNTVVGHGDDNTIGVNSDSLLTVSYLLSNPNVVIENNAFIQSYNVPWLISDETITANNNSFWSLATNSANSPPAWSNNVTTNPFVTVDEGEVFIGSGSALIGSVTAPQEKDIYGFTSTKRIGAVGYDFERVSTLLFSENFDAQPDWATTGRKTLPAELPIGWDAARTDEEWHPADGDVGTQPSMQINGNDPNQVYGGTGKAFITYSESFDAVDDNGYTSDGLLTKDITPTDEIYVRFNIKFQPGWASSSEGGNVKMFRIGHWDGPASGTGERHLYGNTGNSAPMFLYNWMQNNYGIRNFHAFRCDDQFAGNYFCTAPSILGAPRQVVTGDMGPNYTSELVQTDPQIPDLVNGGFITRNADPYVWHDQVWGTQWHTVEFYLKFNSAPGAQDGIYKHWLDGQPIISMTQVPWIGTSGDMNALWNFISIGGNDAFHFDLVGDPSVRERWYAIDNIVVRNALPEILQ